ncbi:MAG: iron export ABC transporter permease subunit FetB [Gammaproteobacteria bacterium]|jgi:putative ABC transport system permease protein|nr:iron export ABC transporter permease subunit FetB [Gammaproteobacteria bacterium]
MTLISLSALDLSVAALLVVLLGVLSWRLHLGIGRELGVAAARTVVQLLLVGLALTAIFEHAHFGWVSLIALVMLLAAGREAMTRQERRFIGWWGFGLGALSMFVSSFTLTIYALLAVIGPEPWYAPQYAIPLLGMVLGNTLTGIALALDRLTQNAWDRRHVIEQRLMLGASAAEAIVDIRRLAMRSGMMPSVNAMAVAGIVSLPGMMTGQILAGAPPLEAVKYQILIMFLITAGTGFGTFAAIWLGAQRLFDGRDRLRLERLQQR